MAPFRWNDAADKEMLMAIMKLSGGLPRTRSQEVSELMDNKVTAYAIDHRLRALRKEYNIDGKDGAPKTPAKKSNTGARGSTGKRKAEQSVTCTGDHDKDDDEEERVEKREDETPSKKKKKKKLQAKTVEEKTAIEANAEEDDSDWLI